MYVKQKCCIFSLIKSFLALDYSPVILEVFADMENLLWKAICKIACEGIKTRNPY